MTRINDVDYDGKYIIIYRLCNYDFISVNDCLYSIISNNIIIQTGMRLGA